MPNFHFLVCWKLNLRFKKCVFVCWKCYRLLWASHPFSFKVVQQKQTKKQQRNSTQLGAPYWLSAVSQVLIVGMSSAIACSNEIQTDRPLSCMPIARKVIKERNLSFLQAVSSSTGTTGRWYYPPETCGSEMFCLSSSIIVIFMQSCNEQMANLTCTNGFGGVPSYSHWVGLHMSSAHHLSLNAHKPIICTHNVCACRNKLALLTSCLKVWLLTVSSSWSQNVDTLIPHFISKCRYFFDNTLMQQKKVQCCFWQNLPRLKQSCNVRPKTISCPADLRSILHLHRQTHN